MNKVKYYKLKKEKNMQDDYVFEKGQTVVLIKEEKGMFFVETEENSEIKRLFWVNKDEVEFLFDKDIIISENFISLL